MTDLDTFRKEARSWLEANCPPEMRQPVKGDDDVCWGGRNWVFSSPAQKQWLDVMAAKGWTVPDWPVAYGGGGLSPEQTKALRQEMAKLNCRSPLNSFGIWMLGPALLKFGTEEQKLHYLPQIARGEIRWCQGYSEPGAGSDLASLRTSAMLEGDHYVVNGQKVWTSYADKADWIFCLVRTDPAAAKHLGISFLLFDMASPGVSTSPIKLISGATAGSASDIVARSVAEKLQAELGVSVVVENKAGAAGTLGIQALLGAPADGHTVLVYTSAHTVLPLINKVAYDPLKDFSAITPLAIVPNVMVVSPSKGYKNVQDVINAAKDKPGQLNYASVGLGSATYMSAEKFKLATGIDAVHVPYKGSPEAITETMTGRVDASAMITTTNTGSVKFTLWPM